MVIELEPIGYVRSSRTDLSDDYWGAQAATIELVDSISADALEGLTGFSHVEVLFYFDQVARERIEFAARRPRNNPNWPRVGIFAQRGKNRPNRLGSTIAQIQGVDGRRLRLSELDAVDGTPIIDLKPVMSEFLPHDEVRQPDWSHELMQAYWSTPNEH
jgi:tRNA (adenine37-N6)-methyltransferase